MTDFSTSHRRCDARMDFDLATASGIDRLIAVSHHAQQKVCATILQSSLIEQLLERPELDLAAVRGLLNRITAISYSAADAVTEMQQLVLEHIVQSADAAPATMAA